MTGQKTEAQDNQMSAWWWCGGGNLSKPLPAELWSESLDSAWFLLSKLEASVD